MRILIWHGYLLGGTGSNVYTRQLAREWSRAGHDVTVLCQEPHPERYDVGGARVVRPDVGGLLPTFVLDRYEGYDVRLLQDCSRAELDAWVEANASTVREFLPADFVLCNHVLLGGAVGRASGARTRSRHTAPSWSTRCAAGPSSKRGGERCSRPRPRRSSDPPTFVRSSRRCAVTSTVSTRCRLGSTSRNGGRERATRRSRRSSPRHVAIRRIPATRTSGSPTRETPSASRSSLPATPPPSSTSGSSCSTRASTCSSRRSPVSTRGR